jgi:hypothetical protein
MLQSFVFGEGFKRALADDFVALAGHGGLNVIVVE